MIFAKIALVVVQAAFMLFAFGAGGAFANYQHQSDLDGQKSVAGVFTVIWAISTLICFALAVI